MNTQPPEQKPYEYDEITRLRMQLHHAEMQRDAFQKAFSVEVLKVMRASVIQASISTDNEVARLQAEVDGLSAQLVELDDLKAKAGQSEAEITRLKSEVERLTNENETINKDKALLWANHKIALQDIQGLHYALQAAKGVQS